MFFSVSIARTGRAPTHLELFADGPHPATAQYEVGDDTLEVEKGVNTEMSASASNRKCAAEQDDVAAFEAPTDGYLTFDARLGVGLADGVCLMLEARNLTDEEMRVRPRPGRKSHR